MTLIGEVVLFIGLIIAGIIIIKKQKKKDI